MANTYFQFRRFIVRQDRCAMKVGTDGTLLGAWAAGGRRILDIGTGTGLIALMMAQRFTAATVTAVDIDADAASQAAGNVAASPFADRIRVVHDDIAHYLTSQPFDAIVTNPPYFVDSLHCPDSQRTQARHTATLPYAVLMASVRRLLADDGELSLIIPFDCRQAIEAEATLAGLSMSRECAVSTTPRKPPRRYLMAFRKHPTGQAERSTLILEEQPGVRSPAYSLLTHDFYL